jgi:NTP pyrophosphatase (non-canonical NTP hydrolase)
MNKLAESIYYNAWAKGFHEYSPDFGVAGKDARHILSWLMLIVTEVAEAAEEVRVGNKVKFAEEMADVIIRALDTCYALDIDIDAAVAAKMEKNKARPIKHGGKLA